MIQLTAQEQQLQKAIGELSEENLTDLADAIGKPSCDVVWFDDSEIVEKAWGWVQEKLNESELTDVPPGILSLQSALKPFKKKIEEEAKEV